MNKRSAMFVAAGLVLSLLVAGLAMAMGVTGPSADAKTAARDRKPAVETVTRTVTIHKKATGQDAGTIVVTTGAPATSTSSDDGAFDDDDAFEDDDRNDDHEDGDDGEDHDDDDHDEVDDDHDEVEHEDDDD
jgi:hypothetical protein